MRAPMKTKGILLFLLLLPGLPLGAAGWEWQLSLGPWTLQPFTSPVERLAGKVVGDEAGELLAPLLENFTVVSYSPRVAMRSGGIFFSAAVWRHVAAKRFAVGLAASYLRFDLPFTLRDDQEIFYQGIPVATITTRGEGRIRLRTFMLAAQGRWRAFQRGRTTAYASLGLALLRFSGDLHLPLNARIRSFLGDAELDQCRDMTLDELREENSGIPAWSLAPALGAALHYRLGAAIRLVIDASLSQGTFLSAGLGFDL